MEFYMGFDTERDKELELDLLELLRFCADNHFIIVSTHPATYSTVVRLEV